MTGCEVHDADGPCGMAVAEVLVFLNDRMHSHVHPDGSLRVCANHLADYLDESVLT